MLWLILALVFVAVGLLCLAVGWAGGRAEGAREALAQVKPMLDEMHWLLRQLGRSWKGQPMPLRGGRPPVPPGGVLRPPLPLRTPEPYITLSFEKEKHKQ